MKIRLGQSKDIPKMLVLLEELMTIEKDFEPNIIAQKKGLEKILIEDSATLLVAVNEFDKVIGMCTSQRLISTEIGGRIALVGNLIIDRHHRGEGVGQELLEAITDKRTSLGFKRMILLVDKDNQRARGFYEKENWTESNLLMVMKDIEKRK
jgi:ribosomal protein S18 acetylase RimI-like enzyme